MTWYRFNSLMTRRAELRLGLRITAAGIIGFALAQMLALPQGYWTVFTAVLVVQGSVGGSLKAAVDRLIGTLSGAVYGAAIATLVPHASPFMMALALGASLLPLALLAALNPSFRVAPITAIILLLGNAGATEGPFLAASMRVLEVGLGGLVGLMVSLVVVPARAHAVMGEEADRLLQLMASLIAEVIGGLWRPSDKAVITRRHDQVQAAFDRLEAAAAEAKREQKSLLSTDADPDPIPRTLRRVYHDLVLIGRVAAEPLPVSLKAVLQPPLERLEIEGREFLQGCGNALAERRAPPSLDGCRAALLSALEQINMIGGDAKLIALGFALEQLLRNLEDLALRTQEFTQRAPPEHAP